jgi:hypothetical protein
VALVVTPILTSLAMMSLWLFKVSALISSCWLACMVPWLVNRLLMLNIILLTADKAVVTMLRLLAVILVSFALTNAGTLHANNNQSIIVNTLNNSGDITATNKLNITATNMTTTSGKVSTLLIISSVLIFKLLAMMSLWLFKVSALISSCWLACMVPWLVNRLLMLQQTNLISQPLI